MAHVSRFVTQPNSHLLCGLCHNVFDEPVINVSCGHTFCQKCFDANRQDNTVRKCPVDGLDIDLECLVLNRALKAQIDDLDVRCVHGLRWEEDNQQYVLDPEGCPTVVKFGDLASHEEHCDFRPVPCPVNPSLCPAVRRRDADQHKGICSFNACIYTQQGCRFSGNLDEVDSHQKSCSFKGLPLSADQLGSLLRSNEELVKKMEQLQSQVTCLEAENAKMAHQASVSDRAMKQLEQRLQRLEGLMHQLPTQASSEQHRRSVNSSPSSRASSVSAPPLLRQESWVMPFQFKCIGTLRGHAQAVHCLAFSGALLLSAGADHTIRIWDTEALARGCQRVLTDVPAAVQSLAVGPEFFYCGGDEGTLSLWRLADFKNIKNLEKAHDHAVLALACSPRFLFSSSHTLIKVWEAGSLDLVHTISGLHHWVRCLVVSSDHSRLYSGSHNTIEIWNTSGNKFNLTGKISHTYGSVHSLALTSKFIIAGTYNHNTHLYDIITQRHVQMLSGHVGCVQALSPSPSGTFLFTASADASIQVWNLENMLPIQTLSRHADGVTALALHGDLLFSGSDDAEIKVFRHFKMDMGFQPK